MSILPKLRISASDQIYSAVNFIVTLNEYTFGFQSVSGLEIDYESEGIEEGGVNDHVLMVNAPTRNFKKLTFKRGMLLRKNDLVAKGAKALAALIPINSARKDALLAASSLSPQSSLEDGPALGTIEVFDRQCNLRDMYTFFSLGMSNWRGDDLNAGSADVYCEEITIIHTGLVRVPVDFGIANFAVKTAQKAVSALNSDENTSSNFFMANNKAEKEKQKQTALKELEKKQNEKNNLTQEKKNKEEEIDKEKDKLESLEKELEKAEQ